MDSVLKVKQAYSQTPWRRQIQTVGLFLTLLVLGLVISLIYVDVSAKAVATGRDIQEMRATIESLERSIDDKQTKLAEITSAVTMEERAKTMGFKPVNPGEAMYLVIPEYTGRMGVVLVPPATPAPVRTVVLSPEYSTSLVDWVKQQLYLPTESQVAQP
jgi:cell division protein FtsL